MRPNLFPLVFIACSLQGYAANNPSNCHFQQTGDRYVGSCGPLFDQTPVITLKSASAITSGTWREDLRPISVWSGEMTDQGNPNATVELEIYPDGWGILRTEYGWFRVTSFQSSPATGFSLDVSQEVKPNALDKKIILRAEEILSTENVWNRADNRKCPQEATSWSIYCAMEKATIEVTGGFHHRRPALELVREVVEDRTRGRPYHHRLMDYNNDPTTKLTDVQTLFRDALARMDDR